MKTSVRFLGASSITLANARARGADVLSVPSFRWIKVADSNNVEKLQGSGIGRTRHHCVKWKEDHGFVIGGYIRNGTDQVNLLSCNPLYPPIRLLNLTNYEWLNSYDPSSNAAYQVNSQITEIIGGE